MQSVNDSDYLNGKIRENIDTEENNKLDQTITGINRIKA